MRRNGTQNRSFFTAIFDKNSEIGNKKHPLHDIIILT